VTIRRRMWHLQTCIAIGASAVVLAACGSSGGGSSSKPPSAASTSTTIDGVKVSMDPQIAAKLPAAIKKSGTLKDITYDNAPPDTFVLNGTTVGWELDIGAGIAAVLGLKFDVTTSDAFETFIPGIQNGKFNVSVSSLIQTPQRLQQIDVVTYYNVGTEFAAKAGSTISITTPTDVCGHTVATLAGSAFVDQLNAINKLCSAAGKPAIKIQPFPSAANMTLAVSNGRDQLFTDSANQLAYIIKQAPGQFVAGALNYDPVAEGAGVTKGIGLTQPVADAVNKLIATGAYAAIMKKWGISAGLVTSAHIYSAGG
jgi:polar amino acid transport system substrate-binding protein